jgi:hypothetical protein
MINVLLTIVAVVGGAVLIVGLCALIGVVWITLTAQDPPLE